jgi:hypothetical protein
MWQVIGGYWKQPGDVMMLIVEADGVSKPFYVGLAGYFVRKLTPAQFNADLEKGVANYLKRAGVL